MADALCVRVCMCAHTTQDYLGGGPQVSPASSPGDSTASQEINLRALVDRMSKSYQDAFKSACIIILFLMYNQLSRTVISIFKVYSQPIRLPDVNGGAPTFYLSTDFSVQVHLRAPAATGHQTRGSHPFLCVLRLAQAPTACSWSLVASRPSYTSWASPAPPLPSWWLVTTATRVCWAPVSSLPSKCALAAAALAVLAAAQPYVRY